MGKILKNKMIDCTNRIKPQMLRDVKTEALLVFIRTTLEQYFLDNKEEQTNYILGSVEDKNLLDSILNELHINLQKYVVTSTYIQTLTYKAQTNIYARKVLKKEEPLIVYYDSLIKQLESSLKQGQNWIPEQLVLCLLSEWVLEEEKSTILYPFLKDIDYISILSKYDEFLITAKKNKEEQKINAIKNMYKAGNDLIVKLKKTNYKINNKRKSKVRKKKK